MSRPVLTTFRCRTARRTWRSRRGDHHRERHRQHADARLQRRVAEHQLEVLGEQEEHAEHGEEDQLDGGRGRRERRVAEEAQVEHRVPVRNSQGRTRPSTARPDSAEPIVAGAVQPWLGPSMIAVEHGAQADHRQPGADRVERVGVGVLRGRHEHATADQATSTSGTLTRKTEPHQKCSSRKPLAIGPMAAPGAGEAGPDGDGLGPLLGREDVGEDRQRRRHDERGADAHHRAEGDEVPGRVVANTARARPTPKISRPTAGRPCGRTGRRGRRRSAGGRRTRGRRRRPSTGGRVVAWGSRTSVGRATLRTVLPTTTMTRLRQRTMSVHHRLPWS